MTQYIFKYVPHLLYGTSSNNIKGYIVKYDYNACKVYWLQFKKRTVESSLCPLFCIIWFENSSVRICIEIYLILWTKVFYFERNSMTTEPQNGLNFHFSLLQSKLLLRPLSPFLSLQRCLLSNLSSLIGRTDKITMM